jgi:hypothetical protein
MFVDSHSATRLSSMQHARKGAAVASVLGNKCGSSPQKLQLLVPLTTWTGYSAGLRATPVRLARKGLGLEASGKLHFKFSTTVLKEY